MEGLGRDARPALLSLFADVRCVSLECPSVSIAEMADSSVWGSASSVLHGGATAVSPQRVRGRAILFCTPGMAPAPGWAPGCWCQGGAGTITACSLLAAGSGAAKYQGQELPRPADRRALLSAGYHHPPGGRPLATAVPREDWGPLPTPPSRPGSGACLVLVSQLSPAPGSTPSSSAPAISLGLHTAVLLWFSHLS